MKNVGIKSEKLCEVSSHFGLVHNLSLVCREYKSGKRLYILKSIFTYRQFGSECKRVYRSTFYDIDTALLALKSKIYGVTIVNINRHMDLPV